MSVETINVQGVEVTLDTALFDDFAMLRLLAKAQKGDLVAVSDIADKILGEEQVERVMGKLATDGVCHVEDMSVFVFECINAAAEAVRAGEGKN